MSSIKHKISMKLKPSLADLALQLFSLSSVHLHKKFFLKKILIFTVSSS